MGAVPVNAAKWHLVGNHVGSCTIPGVAAPISPMPWMSVRVVPAGDKLAIKSALKG